MIEDLDILVWGSGMSSKEHFAKRVKIREELRDKFLNASVNFSEDATLLEELKKAVAHADDLSVPQQELLHLGGCDVCVALDTSKGVGEEIAHFLNSSWSYKLLVLTNGKFKTSNTFPGILREDVNQMFYDDFEYESCNLVSRVITRVQLVAFGKLSGLKV